MDMLGGLLGGGQQQAGGPVPQSGAQPYQPPQAFGAMGSPISDLRQYLPEWQTPKPLAEWEPMEPFSMIKLLPALMQSLPELIQRPAFLQLLSGMFRQQPSQGPQESRRPPTSGGDQ